MEGGERLEEKDLIKYVKQDRIKIKLQATANAPILANTTLGTNKTMLFGKLQGTIKKQLLQANAIQPNDTLYCYLSHGVSPPPNVTLGDLVENYGIDSTQLQIKYALTEAWG